MMSNHSVQQQKNNCAFNDTLDINCDISLNEICNLPRFTIYNFIFVLDASFSINFSINRVKLDFIKSWIAERKSEYNYLKGRNFCVKKFLRNLILRNLFLRMKAKLRSKKISHESL